MIEAIDQVLSYQKLLSRRHQGTCKVYDLFGKVHYLTELN